MTIDIDKHQEVKNQDMSDVEHPPLASPPAAGAVNLISRQPSAISPKRATPSPDANSSDPKAKSGFMITDILSRSSAAQAAVNAQAAFAAAAANAAANSQQPFHAAAAAAAALARLGQSSGGRSLSPPASRGQSRSSPG